MRDGPPRKFPEHPVHAADSFNKHPHLSNGLCGEERRMVKKLPHLIAPGRQSFPGFWDGGFIPSRGAAPDPVGGKPK